MGKSIKKIKKYWDDQAEKYGQNPLATAPDNIFRRMEIESIMKYLKDNKKVLDVGCGNGYSTIRFARKIKGQFIGCDYSGKMIEAAKKALKGEKPWVGKRLTFIMADALSLPFKNETFDIVTSDRCLINLTKLDKQISAAKEIHRVLKNGGLYIMCENTQEGLRKLNQLRKLAGLYKIPYRWHNLYISEKKFFAAIKNIFNLKTIDNFGSTYYLSSRIFNGKLAAIEGKDPDYNHPINQIAAKLPAIGDFCPLKIFVLIKKNNIKQKSLKGLGLKFL